MKHFLAPTFTFLIVLSPSLYSMGIFDDFDHVPPNLTPKILRDKIYQAETFAFCCNNASQCTHLTAGLIAQQIAPMYPWATLPCGAVIMFAGLQLAGMCAHCAQDEEATTARWSAYLHQCETRTIPPAQQYMR